MSSATPSKPEPYVDVQTVADFLGVPKSWVYENARRYGMPHRFAGRYLRFRLTDVEAWLDEQASQGGQS
jgi:excisionase family DNA binding protein